MIPVVSHRRHMVKRLVFDETTKPQIQTWMLHPHLQLSSPEDLYISTVSIQNLTKCKLEILTFDFV